MRIGIVSDVHCNVDGLRTAIERMGDVDELLCAGDTIFEYRFNNEVVELLREREARTILGNHEAVLYGPQGARARAAPHVRTDNLEYLGSMPWLIDVDVGGKRLVLAHGSPIEPLNEYVFPESPGLQRLAQIEADYIILGHTHHQMAVRVGRSLVINPGSAGDPRDPRNGRLLSYAILDTVSGEVVIDDYEASPPA